jgi:hypothetical protein
VEWREEQRHSKHKTHTQHNTQKSAVVLWLLLKDTFVSPDIVCLLLLITQSECKQTTVTLKPKRGKKKKKKNAVFVEVQPKKGKWSRAMSQILERPFRTL